MSSEGARHVSRHGGQGIEVTMPYIIVRESYINNSCVVDGLPSNEVRLITEKVSPVMSINDPAPDTLCARPRQPGGRETLGIVIRNSGHFFNFSPAPPRTSETSVTGELSSAPRHTTFSTLSSKLVTKLSQVPPSLLDIKNSIQRYN